MEVVARLVPLPVLTWPTDLELPTFIWTNPNWRFRWASDPTPFPRFRLWK